MRPVPIGADESFMGEHVLTRPASTQEIREFRASVDRKIDGMVPTIAATVTRTVIEGLTRLHLVPTPPTALPIVPHMQPNTAASLYVTLGSKDSSSNHVSAPCLGPIRPTKHGRRHSAPAVLGASIPRLPPGSAAWEEGIRQWTTPDPSTGLALKDWPSEWYTGAMTKVNGPKYTSRRIIFEEFERCVIYIPLYRPLLMEFQ